MFTLSQGGILSCVAKGIMVAYIFVTTVWASDGCLLNICKQIWMVMARTQHNGLKGMQDMKFSVLDERHGDTMSQQYWPCKNYTWE